MDNKRHVPTPYDHHRSVLITIRNGSLFASRITDGEVIHYEEPPTVEDRLADSLYNQHFYKKNVFAGVIETDDDVTNDVKEIYKLLSKTIDFL